MIKPIYGIAVGMLSIGLLAGCGNDEDSTSGESENENQEETNGNQEETNQNQEDLAYIGTYGKVTVISEADPFTLEGNEDVSYELSDIQLVKIEDFTEDGIYQIAYGMSEEDVNNLPESVYALIGTEHKKNNTDIAIEFLGVHELAAGSTQIDVFSDDFVTESNSGSNMLSGVEKEEQFAVIVEDPDIESLIFVLSRAFDSETHEEYFLEEEQHIERTLIKK